MNIISRLSLLLLIFVSCNSNDTPPPATPLTKEQKIPVNIDSLKRTAESCDLIVREGDDFISNQIRFINEKDKRFSHAGLIVEKDGKKLVCHIAPAKPPADTIQYIPIDSFIDPKLNLYCALYRFDLSAVEKDTVVAIIDDFKKRDIRFDRRYDLNTTDKLYCTEMIYHALKEATHNRIDPKLASIPKKMYKLLLKYFEQEKITPEIISRIKIVAIDNVYLVPQAKLVMEFPLKYFPGQ